MPLRFTGAGVSKAKKKNKQTYQPPTPPRWKGRDSLDLAYLLNCRFFKVVSDLAAITDTQGWPVMEQNRALWSALNAQAIERAARFPFLILDVHFLSDTWWREVIGGAAATSVYHWPASVSDQLMSETLIFAWHTAKWDRGVARLSLGMSPAVAELIAALTPQQLSTISARHSGALRLRWQDDADFWTRLLVAAREGDEDELADIHLHANLRLSGALLAG
jgi:hypothetical protein